MIRTMVQLTEEQLKALKELAKARKTSVAKLVRESVAQYIATAPKELTYEEKRQRAFEFIKQIEEGKFKAHNIEGKTDVSVNHDKYPAEIYSVQDVFAANRRQLSLVDCSSFETMRRVRIEKVFTFDEHFREQGFEVIPRMLQSVYVL